MYAYETQKSFCSNHIDRISLGVALGLKYNTKAISSAPYFYLSGTKLFPENLALSKQHSDWCLSIGTKSFLTNQMDFEDKFFIKYISH